METSIRQGPELLAPISQSASTHIWGAVRHAAIQHDDFHADFMTSLTNAVPELKDVVFVDSDPVVRYAVQYAIRLVADVEVCSEFSYARARVLAKPPDLLVTNLRLEAYNGLHLVYLAAGTPTRCVVYATEDDLVLARAVQAAGAFYERSTQLPLILPSYVNATLPRWDRRDPAMRDRLRPFSGGRRCTDQRLFSQ